MVIHDDGGDDDRDRDESASYRHDGAFRLQNSLNFQNVLTQAQEQALLPQVQEQALLQQVQEQALLQQVQQQVLLLLQPTANRSLPNLLHTLQLILLSLVLQQLLLQVLQLLQHGLVLAQQQQWVQPQELMTPDTS